MSQSQAIYLGRSGRAFGPITQQKYEAMEQSGEIKQYSWIWDHASSKWAPLDPAPSPLQIENLPKTVEAPIEAETPALETNTVPQVPHAVAGTAPRPQKTKSLKYAAICHNFESAVSGQCVQVTATGCELASTDGGTSPSLALNSAVFINLLDEKSGKSVNVQAQLFDAMRGEQGWTYRIRWAGIPSL